MLCRRMIVVAMIAGAPAFAGAQFTTFIPPQSKVVDSAKAVVVMKTKARADSAVNMQLANMKTWVDSAAGVATVPTGAGDSLMSAAAPPPSATTMRNGRRAPATASALPMLTLLGALTLGLGIFLLVGPLAPRARGQG